jgi:hypothetical protein
MASTERCSTLVSPWENGFAERWVATLRRELLNQTSCLGSSTCCAETPDSTGHRTRERGPSDLTTTVGGPITGTRGLRDGKRCLFRHHKEKGRSRKTGHRDDSRVPCPVTVASTMWTETTETEASTQKVGPVGALRR